MHDKLINQRTGDVEIDCQSVKAMLDAGEDFVFLDCREQSEYDTVKIEGASLLPMSEIQTRVGEIEKHKNSKMVIHCHHGGRSLNVAMWLKGQGFENVSSMTGGIDVWAQEIDSTLPRY
ncbi:MAG: rhodanese-like domain-containing protein [Fuerstiella sp.]